MSFAALTALTQRNAAHTFSRNAAGEPLSAWFPATAEAKPATLAGYTLAAEDVSDGPMKFKTAEALGLHLSKNHTVSIGLAPLSYLPVRSVTTFLLGYPLTGSTLPDPARVQRFCIEEYRTGAGSWEIDAKKIQPLSS